MGVLDSKQFSDAKTPACNDCGIALCYDISSEEYEEAKPFWDEWTCLDCNDGKPKSLKRWREEQTKIGTV